LLLHSDSYPTVPMSQLEVLDKPFHCPQFLSDLPIGSHGYSWLDCRFHFFADRSGISNFLTTLQSTEFWVSLRKSTKYRNIWRRITKPALQRCYLCYPHHAVGDQLH